MSGRWLLQLAAAALGALLLLAAAGPSVAQDDVGDPDSLTPAEVSLTLGVGASATVSKTLHLEASPPKADVILAVDTTGSMGAAINDAKADATSIVNQIQSSIPGARFAVIDFKDYPFSPFGGAGDYAYLLRQPLTTNAASVQAAVNAIGSAAGGGDLPESFNRVVFESYSDTALGRDTTAPAFLVFLGDDLPHDAGQNAHFPSCPNRSPTDPGRDADDGTNDSTADDLPTKTVLDGAKANHINVSMVVYNPRAEVTSCWSQLAAYTGGQQVTRTATGSLTGQIVDLIEEDAARIDGVTLTTTPASFASWLSFTPPTPYGPFTAPIDIEFDETITVPSGTAEGTYAFTVQAIADGAVRATQDVTVTVRKQAVSSLQLTADEGSRPAGVATVPFTNIPDSLIPAFAGNIASTPGGSIPGGSIPGGSIPGGSIPGGSIPGGSIPGGSIPGGSITFGSLGFRSIPGGSIPGGSIPGGSIPGGSIGLQRVLQTVLLSQIPLTNPASGATWEQVLAGTALEGRPTSTMTLYDVATEATGQAWARLTALPLGDVPLGTTLWGGVPLAAWLLGNAALDQLPPPAPYATWAAALDASGGSSANLDTSQNTVFGVGISGQLGRTDIGSIPGGSIPGGSIPGGSIPGGSIPGGSIPAREIPLIGIDIPATRLATVTLADISPLADIVNCGGAFNCAGKSLGQAYTADAIKPSATFGMLLDRLPAAHPARQMTISELIFGFLSRSHYPFEQLNVQGMQTFAGTGQNVHYHVDFDFDCSLTSTFSSISVGLPPGEFPVAGTTTFSFAGGAPVAAADSTSLVKGEGAWTAKWTTIPAGVCNGTATRHVQMNFEAYERLSLGEHTASASVVVSGGETYSAVDQAPVEVTQNREPDGTPAQATLIQKDTLYVGHVGFAGDQDVYRFPIGGLEPGTKVAAFVKVPSGADFDLVLRKPEAPGVRSSPGGSIPGGSIPIEDPGAFVDNRDRPLPPDTLSDVPVSTPGGSIPGGSIPGGSIPGGSIPGGSIPGGSISANRGASTEAAQIVTAGESGEALIDVSGYVGSHSREPYVLRVKVTDPPPLPTCPAVTGLGTATPGALPTPASLPADTKTLFLINRQRMVGLYDALSVDTLLNSPTSPLNVVAQRAEVKGVVLPVDGNSAVRAAYAAWDTNPCSITAVNNVVRKINDLVDMYRAARPGIKYISLLGPDPALPSWRQLDRVAISPEVDEAGELVRFTNDLAAPNALYASAARNHVLVDGAYGVRNKKVWLGSELPLPEDSVSRFLESPTEISEWLDAYDDTGGLLNPASELTTGDEFFTDSAGAAHTALLAGFPGITGATLFPPTNAGWSKSDLLTQFFNKAPKPPDISALYAHYNPWLSQPAGPTPITSLSDLASTADLPASAIDGKIVYTIGCHSGLNVYDGYPGDAAEKKDWAQSYKGGIYVANTGFGYDDTESIALSGRLMWLFSQKVNRGTGSIGEQWVDAVNTYYTTAGDWDVLDEKVMLQATFYGPPWAHFGTPSSPPAEPPLTIGPDAGLGLDVASVTMNPTIHENTTGDGRKWWDIDNQTLSVEYRSIQPMDSRDVTVAGKHAHDPFITDLEVHDLANIKPVRAYPVIRSSQYEPIPNFPNIFWPAIPVTVLESSFGSSLNLVAGQFRPNGDGSELGSERLIDSISVDIAYTTANRDGARPLITDAGAVMTGPTSALIFVRVTDISSSLNKVAALYNDGVNNFKFVQLNHVSGDLYTKEVTGLAGPPEVIGEARGADGDVGFSANKAVNFTAITDNGAPEIAIASPLPSAVFTLGQAVPADYHCSDEGGIASCDGDVANGVNVDTATVGSKSFTVDAEDLTGNDASKSVSYVVHYSFLGFFPPVDNPPVLNSVKAGSTIPLKWKLQGAGGTEVTTLDAVTSVSSKAIKCPAASVDPIESTVPASLTPLKYDAAAKQYVYTWLTEKSWAGTCREVFVGFLDGTHKSARFQFK